MAARVFGTPSEVRQLAKLIKLTLDTIEEGNKNADRLLQQLSTTSKDKSYNTAEAVVEEVKAIVESCKIPAEEVENQLMDYAAFLDPMVNG